MRNELWETSAGRILMGTGNARLYWLHEHDVKAATSRAIAREQGISAEAERMVSPPRTFSIPSVEDGDVALSRAIPAEGVTRKDMRNELWETSAGRILMGTGNARLYWLHEHDVKAATSRAIAREQGISAEAERMVSPPRTFSIPSVEDGDVALSRAIPAEGVTRKDMRNELWETSAGRILMGTGNARLYWLQEHDVKAATSRAMGKWGSGSEEVDLDGRT
ncbi:hypothetical protein ACEUZ9_005473 [Paracoccus litorisediminis]|uniref:hypothetical protein n=1 Tax=Paracoccus litorisediminis TaxID=2006130 RepID=UPI0037312112